MNKNSEVYQQLTQWVDELRQVRGDFAVGINPGQADDDFDRILKEMKEFIASTQPE